MLDALQTMRARGAASACVRPEAQRAYNEEIQRKLARSVWSIDAPDLEPARIPVAA